MVCTARIQKSSFAVGEMSTGLTNQLGFEIPSWVQIPSGAGIFPSSPVGSINSSFHIYHSHICSLRWLVGCISGVLKGDCVMQL